jgi:hypothetical protein
MTNLRPSSASIWLASTCPRTLHTFFMRSNSTSELTNKVERKRLMARKRGRAACRALVMLMMSVRSFSPAEAPTTAFSFRRGDDASWFSGPPTLWPAGREAEPIASFAVPAPTPPDGFAFVAAMARMVGNLHWTIHWDWLGVGVDSDLSDLNFIGHLVEEITLLMNWGLTPVIVPNSSFDCNASFDSSISSWIVLKSPFEIPLTGSGGPGQSCGNLSSSIVLITRALNLSKLCVRSCALFLISCARAAWL